MALDSRGSERITNFRWVCRRCRTQTGLFGGNCSACQWPVPDAEARRMDIEVHRAGRTYYAHSAVLLNIPQSELDAFFRRSDWQVLASAKFLELTEMSGRSLSDFAPDAAGAGLASIALTVDEMNDLFDRHNRGEFKTTADMTAAMQAMQQRKQRASEAASPVGILRALEQHTGVSREIWNNAGQELLEALMPTIVGQPEDVFRPLRLPPRLEAADAARTMGLSQATLVSDFPMITATYAYSRAGYAPRDCFLRPFPPAREHGGRPPIYVDKVQVDALVLSLSPARVASWLAANGCAAIYPDGDDVDLARRAYFVALFDSQPLRETLRGALPEARLVFGLLHTLSHFAVRQAALLCGLDRTSLSEYLLPKTLTAALYANHRSGATIGALTALFEQSLFEWLTAIREARRCVYDPDCREQAGACHYCTYLSENSCRFFNLNLGRSFLFGGRDPELGSVAVGYFDPSLP